MGLPLRTERLQIRDWTVDDAAAALDIYGAAEVTRWLIPARDPIRDKAAMRSVLEAWIEAQPNLLPPRGRWAVERGDDGVVIGGLAIRLLPPYEEDLEIRWQFAPQYWGAGYATEAVGALIRWAFTKDVDELFAVARPSNARAIAGIERLGLEWVGETTKYYNLALQVYRIRPSDLAEQ